jgi:hypothetical protein
MYIHVVRRKVISLGLIGLVLCGCSSPGGGQSSPHRIESAYQFSFRPVLCETPPVRLNSTVEITPSVPSPPLGCAPSNRFNVANLDVQVDSSSADGFASREPSVDYRYQFVLNAPKSDDTANVDVLLSQEQSNRSTIRYVLGPAELTDDSIASAQAANDGSGQWVVDITFTKYGLIEWDAFAGRQFHEEIATVINGEVVSAPLIQPTQTTFTSFNGSGDIKGNWSEEHAVAIAAALS